MCVICLSALTAKLPFLRYFGKKNVQKIENVYDLQAKKLSNYSALTEQIRLTRRM